MVRTVKETRFIYTGPRPPGPPVPATPKFNAGDVVTYRPLDGHGNSGEPEIGTIIRIEAFWHERGRDPVIAYVTDTKATLWDWQIIASKEVLNG